MILNPIEDFETTSNKNLLIVVHSSPILSDHTGFKDLFADGQVFHEYDGTPTRELFNNTIYMA